MKRPAAPRGLMALAVTAVLLAPVFFWNLDAFPLRIWDESRLATNALEMVRSGDGLVTRFEGRPDLWNTKPPLLIWVQAAAIRVLGPGDLAVRLPSALAGWLTGLLLVAFAQVHLKRPWIGVAAAFILATAPGFTGMHAARTADYDAPLTLLTTASGLSWYLFLETARRRYVYGFWLALALGILTKGVGAVLFLPALGLHALATRKTRFLLTSRHVWLGLLGLTVLVAGYYALREAAGPGYLAEVLDNELGGRYLRTLEGHGESPVFFLQGFWQGRLGPWPLVVLLGTAAGFLRRRPPLSGLLRFATLLSGVYLLVISLSRTKCRWYDVPLYPFLALLAAGFLVMAGQALLSSPVVSGHRRARALVPVAVGLLFLNGYGEALRRARHPEDNPGWYQLGYALKAGLDGRLDLQGTRVLLQDYSPQNKFYLQLLRDQGCDIAAARLEDLVPGDRVLVQDDELARRLKAGFRHRLETGPGPHTFFLIEAAPDAAPATYSGPLDATRSFIP